MILKEKIKIVYIGNKLSKKGYNVTTIDTLSSLLELEGYRLVTASSLKNPLLRLMDMLFVVLKNRKADYLLIDTYSTSAFWFAFLASQLARILNIEYIPILHGGNLPNRLRKNPKLCQLIFGNAYKNVAPSNYLLKYFTEAGFENIFFIPNSIEIEKYQFKLRTDLKPKLLWVRAFASIYNPKMAVDVLIELKKKYPLAELCMIGPDKDGSLEQTKKYAHQQGVDIVFAGKLSKEQWITISQNYAIFINTTHFDNTPVSVIEAMALGLPVVSTRVGGIPLLLSNKENALLVADNNPKQMVSAIHFLLMNPDKALDIANQARKKVEAFDWKQVKNLWKEILS
ncbi:glycosyltransferase family 4 protein [Flavobacterium covae]|uniref:glycosyltransferase family 4 protein n=1 Tax=Flavobacterium covae TaxID=2906076 RepID=UPI000B4CF205|nr:glycosyltransferase family 4 protein [Flavobacterium covae]OWP86944.1 glycosyl transferase family 1 [Flavobacterium covae]